VGIGSLVPRSNDVEFIERVVKEVRAVLGRSVWLHLFGVANIDVLKRVAKHVDSVDVSTPTLAAAKKEMIIWKDGRFLRLKTTSLTNISSLGQLIEETTDAFEKELLTKILDAKTISEKNRLLMIYNTYVLQKYINRFI
jgi:queuine/archaeosine tRNA-ribosyltransferase